MNDQTTQRKPDITVMPEPGLAQSKGELMVMAPTLADLTAKIKKGHGEVERAALNVVGWAIETGKALRAAKETVGHGNFEEYVASECPFSMRAAQNYMKLALHEDQIRQDLEDKAQGFAFLKVSRALRHINALSANGKRRKRAKPKHAEP